MFYNNEKNGRDIIVRCCYVYIIFLCINLMPARLLLRHASHLSLRRWKVLRRHELLTRLQMLKLLLLLLLLRHHLPVLLLLHLLLLLLHLLHLLHLHILLLVLHRHTLHALSPYSSSVLLIALMRRALLEHLLLLITFCKFEINRLVRWQVRISVV